MLTKSQGTFQTTCLINNSENDSFESLESIDDVEITNKQVCSIKSKCIKDLYSENANKSEIAEFSIVTQEDEFTFACDCNSLKEFKNFDYKSSQFLIINELSVKEMKQGHFIGLSKKPVPKGSKQCAQYYKDSSEIS